MVEFCRGEERLDPTPYPKRSWAEGGQYIENYQEEALVGRGFWHDRPNRILAEGRLRGSDFTWDVTGKEEPSLILRVIGLVGVGASFN